MTETLSSCIQLIINTFNSIVDFCFSTAHPGFTTISIGAVMIACFMLSLGFDYLDLFLGSSHVRGDSK